MPNAPSPQALRACAEIDAVAGDLAEWPANSGRTVTVVSEYGITPVTGGIDINRVLRRAVLLRVHHQLPHVYVKRSERIAEVRAVDDDGPRSRVRH